MNWVLDHICAHIGKTGPGNQVLDTGLQRKLHMFLRAQSVAKISSDGHRLGWR